MDSRRKMKLRLIDISSEDSKSRDSLLDKSLIPTEVRKTIHRAMKKVLRTRIAHTKKVYTRNRKL